MQQNVSLIFYPFCVTSERFNATIKSEKPQTPLFGKDDNMKISRTLKRLRSEKGLTQEELARLLFISRQSVSSWENDRTQPDIDMLIKLSEIFSVSVEELIYGKRRNTELETEKPNHTATLITVFSILGSLLAGTGIILIFVTFWEKMPSVSKAILSFLPLVAGQSAALFVLSKKRGSVPWCEGAGILWTAGIAATLVLLYNIFDLSIQWYTILIIISVLIFPVMLILGCISPLAVFYGCSISWLINIAGADNANLYLSGAVCAFIMLAGCIFTVYKLKKEKRSVVSLFSAWITVVAFTVFAGVLSVEYNFALFSIICVGLCLLAVSFKEADLFMPCRIPGLLLTGITLVTGSYYFDSYTKAESYYYFISAAFFAAVLLSLVLVRRHIKDKPLLLYIILCLTAAVILVATTVFVPSSVKYDYIRDIMQSIMKIIIVLADVLLMISGAKSRNLLHINAGFISVAAVSVIFIYTVFISTLAKGLVLLAFGAVFLIINLWLTKSLKKAPAAAIPEEVPGNE